MFTVLANELLDKKEPASYNQAIMDFGATVCKPQVPLCKSCVFSTKCMAYKNGSVQSLPVKEKSIIKKNRYFYYFIATYNGKIYIHKREKNDIWAGLYEFILIENSSLVAAKADSITELFTNAFKADTFKIKGISTLYKQQLTHQTLEAKFILVELLRPLSKTKYQLVPIEKIKKLPFPKLITSYFKDHNNFLN
jgi:A/G-specific adenine glycosylase